MASCAKVPEHIMKILLLGGGGFIGSNIADRLLQEGLSIRIFERARVAPYRNFAKHEKIEWITGDFSSEHDVSAAIEGVDVVLHLVSTTLPKGSNDDPLYDVQSNVIPTLQLLKAMVKKNVSKIVFISSGGTVYGLPTYLPIDEQHSTSPLVSYGITKLTIEKYLMLYERMYGIRAIILRVSNAFGERQRIETAQGAVGVFIHRALYGLPIEIWGDGSITRDYIYIKDVADAFIQAITYHGTQRIFNISTGHGVSINELLLLIEEVFDHTIEHHYLPARTFDVPINVLCNELAKKELNWTPKVSIRQGIELTIKWMKSNYQSL